MLGSVCHPDARVRRKAVDHLLECVDIMDATGSRDLKLWFADGTNYPGQDDIRARQDRLAESLRDGLRPPRRRTSGSCSSTSSSSRRSTRPTCPTGGPRWSTASRSATEGEGRRRHRPPRARHEHRVHRRVAAPARQARRVRLQLAVLRGRRPDGRLGRPVPAVPDHARGREGGRADPKSGVAFMLDQCHNIEPKIPGQIRSVMNVQEATAKALLVDRPALDGGPGGRRRPRRERGPDGRLRHRRPAAARRPARADMGLDPDPMAAYARSGYAERIVDGRVGGQPGRLGRMSIEVRDPERAALLDAVEPARRGPAEHELRGRQHVGQGHGDRPGHRRRPSSCCGSRAPAATSGRSPRPGSRSCGWTGCARSSTSTRASSARTRWSRAFDYCLFGRGGAAPSIDTAMHGLVDATHVDHLHPDSGIAFATAADGEALTRECFGDRVAWVAVAAPGFQLGLDIAAIRRDQPEAIGAILGGHGITAWGDTSEACEANSLEIIRTAERYIAEHGRPEPFGPSSPGTSRSPEAERRARAAALLPVVRGLASTDRPQVGHFTDDRRRPRLPGARAAPAAGGARHVVPRPLPADQGPPAGPRPAADRPARGRGRAPARAPRGLSRRVPRLLRAARDARLARRCAAPTRRSCWSRASGCSSFGANKQTARVAGEFYVNAINVMRGAEALSTYAPIAESEKFRIEYWALEEAKLAPPAEAEAARDAGRVRHRRRVRHRQGDRAPAGGRGRLRRRRRHRRGQRRGRRRGDRRAGRRRQRASPT